MAYVHDGTGKLKLDEDPIDADAEDWFYFVFGPWLRSGEAVTVSEALVVGGTVLSGPTYYASLVDSAGVTRTHIQAIKAKPASGAEDMEITCRVTTALGGNPTLGRKDDRTIQVKVKQL